MFYKVPVAHFAWRRHCLLTIYGAGRFDRL